MSEKKIKTKRGRVSRTLNSLVSWPPLDEIDGDTEHLVHLVEAGWDFAWPGWQWVADRLNDRSGNKRTAQACRAKYWRLNAKWVAKQKAS